MPAAAAAFCLADNFIRGTIERRPIEAMIEGMLAVNRNLMYQAMVRETKGASTRSS
jgi:hypothetical protein